jgi:DNA replication protein DnaC
MEMIHAEILAKPLKPPGGNGSDAVPRRSTSGTSMIQVQLETLRRQVGRRYSGCSLQNFKLSDDLDVSRKQQTVLAAVQAYVDSLKDRIADGCGLFLFGPAGVGKDHLLTAVMLETVGRGFGVAWFNGQDLYGQFRDAITNEASERQTVDRLTEPSVLALSDPIPPSGDVTPFQRSMLFRVIDRRYRDQRPTWITANVADRSEADSRFGVQLVERLTHESLCLPCNWPSYRVARWKP